MDKTGLGKHLFKDRRTGDLRAPPFILDISPYQTSEILITGPRFGIGSSREQAVWSLTDFGIRCIIAPSFGDIFFANCLKNGLLPIRLGGERHECLMQAAKEGASITIDLPFQTIILGTQEIEFDVPSRGKELLLSGLDETAAILTQEAAAIELFETRQRAKMPWLYSKQRLKRKSTS
jgi:3-isopropylmalate/(R)-2-methylmalate dehydratase small subunit